MDFTIISEGKLKEQYFKDCSFEYEKRIKGFNEVSKLSIIDVLDNNSIIKKIPSGSYVFSLCIEGEMLTSEGFSKKLSSIYLSEKKGICFLIGGSNGLSEEVKSHSDMRISMSRMTFPHRLAKIMLLEQLYRSLSIQNNKKYHK